VPIELVGLSSEIHAYGNIGNTVEVVREVTTGKIMSYLERYRISQTVKEIQMDNFNIRNNSLILKQCIIILPIDNRIS
jgi:hypothetical protein